MPVENDLAALAQFEHLLRRVFATDARPLLVEEQRELVALARRFAQASHAEEVAIARTLLAKARAERRAAVEQAQCSLLRGELLERAGELLESACTSADARAAWVEAKA